MIQYSQRLVSIQNIVAHCFGDHDKYDGKWSRLKFDASYKHKSLPH